jgi:hypothetical protein
MKAVIDSIESNEWGGLVGQSDCATAFHEYEWGQMTADQFNGRLETYTAVEGNRQWLIPVFTDLPWQKAGEAQTSIIGYGGPLPVGAEHVGEDELAASEALLEKVGTDLGLTSLKATLYPANFWPAESDDPRISFGHTCKVGLVADTEKMFDEVISGNSRTAIRKSEKSGVIVDELAGANDERSEAALALLQSTQRAVGSSYQTELKLFDAINALDVPNLGSATYIAEVDTAAASMAVCVFNRREMFHLFLGWDRQYASTSANQALHWQMIKKAVSLKLSTYNMGESHTPEIAKAKLRWGGQIEAVPKISIEL